jgi:hypothetical protein
VTSKKPILEFYSVVKTVQYIGRLFASCAHNLLSSCLPTGRARNLLPPPLPGVRRGRLDIHWYEYVCYSCYFHSLATKIAVLVTVTRSCFCRCDFFDGELWRHDPHCRAVLLVVAMARAFECFPPRSHTGQGGCDWLLSCGVTMMFWCYQCHLVKARIPLLAGFFCSRNFANERHGDGAKKTALESRF